jgi:6-phosphogluconate dehydrogenase
MNKKIGFIGLGKMGNAMVAHMIDQKIDVVVYNRTKEKTDEITKIGAIPTYSIEELVSSVRKDNGSCIIWLMVSAGAPVDEMLTDLKPYLDSDDVIIDGGNSYYKDSQRRAADLASINAFFFDCGTSGGIEGARNGACLMIGGDPEAFKKNEWLFQAIAQAGGYGYMGPSGSGHFVKMVHNAIEYGMMQSIAEGLDLLENGTKEPLGVSPDLREVLKVWNHGSIVQSYLTKVTQDAIEKDQHLDKVGDYVEDNGEGAWTMLESIAAKIPFLTVCYALYMRYTTRRDESFAMKVIAAQRNEFGGHKVEQK